MVLRKIGKMKTFLCIDILQLKKIEEDLINFSGYDRSGWIKEAIQELIDFDSIKKLKPSEVLALPPRYKFSRSFPVFMEESFLGTFDLIIKRLKLEKKSISRNILVGEAIRRKLEKNKGLKKRNSNDHTTSIKDKTIFGIRIDPEILRVIRKLVLDKKQKMQGYTISDWIESAMERFFKKKTEISPFLKHRVSSKTANRISVVCSTEIFKKVQSFVGLNKLKNFKFSRNTLVYEMIIQKLIEEKALPGREFIEESRNILSLF